MLVRPQFFLASRHHLGKRLAHVGKGYSWHQNRHIEDPVARIHAHIHYLTDHAPYTVQARWKQAKARWNARTRWWKASINERL